MIICKTDSRALPEVGKQVLLIDYYDSKKELINGIVVGTLEHIENVENDDPLRVTIDGITYVERQFNELRLHEVSKKSVINEYSHDPYPNQYTEVLSGM